jgi:hypothetical protein
MTRTRGRLASLSVGLAVVIAAGGAVLLTSAGPAGALTRGEGTGKAWCARYGGTSLAGYRRVYACKLTSKGTTAGKTPFDSFAGFQPTELANRFLFRMTGNTLFDNDVAGNFTALAAASFAIPAATSGVRGSVPAAGDIISEWGGTSKQKQDGDRTMVAVVTDVTATSSGWTIRTLNQDRQYGGAGTITVSSHGRTWSAENGFYAAFEWLRLVGGGGGAPGGGSPGGGSPGGWTATEAPRLAASATGQLLAVACSAAANCTAAGASGSSAMLAARDGRGWTAVPVPLPASSPSRSRLTAVTCPSGNICVAAGDYVSGGAQQGLLLSGHGGSWTATRAPLPAGAAASPNASVRAVACADDSSCVAVGQYTAATSGYPLLITGHGSSWTGRRAPLPADAAARPDAGLVAVACPAAGACTAVGSYVDNLGNRQGMLVTGHGSSWTATRAPLPASATVPGAELSAVACPQTTPCVAAGSYSGDSLGLLVSGEATSWTATRAPLPAGAGANPKASFRAIACYAGSCAAVGSYTDAAGSSQGMLVTRRGSELTAAAAPLPASAAARQGRPGAQLDSVACPSASACVAVGEYTDTAGDAQTLLLAGLGASWQATRAPVPANARPVGTQAQGALAPPELSSAACPSVSACVAVGSYPARKAGIEGLIVTGPS